MHWERDVVKIHQMHLLQDHSAISELFIPGDKTKILKDLKIMKRKMELMEKKTYLPLMSVLQNSG